MAEAAKNEENERFRESVVREAASQCARPPLFPPHAFASLFLPISARGPVPLVRGTRSKERELSEFARRGV